MPPLAAGVEFWWVTALSQSLLLPEPQVCPCLALTTLFRYADNVISIASFDVLSPNWIKLPAYLKETQYRNPTDSMNAAFHRAHNTTSHFMAFLATKPDFQRSFQVYMSGFNEGRTD